MLTRSMLTIMAALQSAASSSDTHPFEKTISTILTELASAGGATHQDTAYLDADSTEGNPLKDLGVLALKFLQSLCGGHELVCRAGGFSECKIEALENFI